MNNPLQIKRFHELDTAQVARYKAIVQDAFPEVLFLSDVVATCWEKIETYFPAYQVFLIDAKEDIVGFINSIPLRWDGPMIELPDDGWDWLVKKGLIDYEKGIIPNCIGGLQIIVAKSYLGQGVSKKLIQLGKELQVRFSHKNFIIPIRPTFKCDFPKMEMESYIHYKKEDKIYDPWIRTHLASGADIIKVCHNAMNIIGDISTWERLYGKKILKSGKYEIEGALSFVTMDVEKNIGEYREPNVWIKY